MQGAGGRVLGGRFELLGELGRGGMGVVYRARELSTDRLVALKVVQQTFADADGRARFEREGQLTASLRHPGIVTVHSAGELDGRPFLAYELVAGARTLEAALPHLDRDARVALVLELARALGHAHEHGVVHRDVKPANVLLDEAGHVRLADFGLATAVDLERLTKTGEMLGTPSYMSPEQLDGQRANEPAVDVWALGAVLYRALTDTPPFEVGSIVQLAYRVLEGGPPRAPRSIDPAIPAALDAVVMKALRRDPRQRHRDGADFAHALERALEGAEEAAPRGRSLVPLLAVMVAVVALAAVGLALTRRWRAEETGARVAALSSSISAFLGQTGPIAEAAGVVSALRADLAALRQEGLADRAPLDHVGRRLDALEGLVALSSGDVARAEERSRRCGDVDEGAFLEGALAAVTSAGGGPDTAAALAWTDARRPEVHTWRALAALAEVPSDALTARRALSALEGTTAREGPLLTALRVCRARGWVALGEDVEAARALEAERPPRDVAWGIAVLALERAVGGRDPDQAVAALPPADADPAPPRLRPALSELTGRARDLVDRRVLDLEAGRATPADVLPWLRVVRRLEPGEAAPRGAVAALLDASVSMHRKDLPLAVALADLLPEDLQVQEAVSLFSSQLREDDDKRACLPALRRTLALAPASRALRLAVRMGEILADLREHDECLEVCERFLPAAEDDPEARGVLLGLRGVCRRRLGDSVGALDDLTRVVDVNRDPMFSTERVLALQDVGRGDEAFDAAVLLVGALEHQAGLTGRMAIVAWAEGRGRPERADRLREALERMMRLYPELGAWWTRLALMQVEAGQGDAAATSLAMAAATLPTDNPPAARVLSEVGTLVDPARALAPAALERLRDIVGRLDALRGTPRGP